VKIRPKQFSIHPIHHVEEVMVIIPVDAYIQKAQHIADEYWNERFKIADVIRMGNFQFKDENGNNDGEHAVAESFKSIFMH
jgi:hypothetical protein